MTLCDRTVDCLKSMRNVNRDVRRWWFEQANQGAGKSEFVKSMCIYFFEADLSVWLLRSGYGWVVEVEVKVRQDW